jgi:high-affinity nickel-transport protein
MVKEVSAMFRKVWDCRSSWGGYFIVILLLHIIGIFGLITSRADAYFWGLGLLAYTLGLRHAFDIDHIAAIDNTVRKLVQQKRNPLGVGFYFALGHSTMVLIMVLAVTFSVQWIQNEMPQFEAVGGIIGSVVLSGFLITIGIINLIILLNLFEVYRKTRSGNYQNEQVEALLENRGLFTRYLRPFFRFISRSWHVYPLGFLFGLGFDTATEVGLLALSAGAAQNEVSMLGILSLPLLFAAGMSLMDTADGMFMTTAYRWAFSAPIRKLYYNMTVTAISVIAALLVGVVELMKVVSENLHVQTGFLQWIQKLDFSDFGYVLVVLFVVAWSVSVMLWRNMKVKKGIPLQSE